MSSREGSRNFFFNDTATTEIYTLSLHDALPICLLHAAWRWLYGVAAARPGGTDPGHGRMRSGRSEEHTSELHHSQISYAVFCLKKKINSGKVRPNHKTNINILSRRTAQCVNSHT